MAGGDIGAKIRQGRLAAPLVGGDMRPARATGASRVQRTLRRSIVVVALLAALAYALHVVLWRSSGVEGTLLDDSFSRLAGVVHVHTTCSDGGGTPEEVVAAARATGLGFVVITDHNTLDAKRVEGYHGGLLAIVGAELSTDSGHVLGLGIPDPVFRFSRDVTDTMEDIRDLGGHAFAAHPVSRRDDFRWTAWDQPGGWGLELLNGDSQWREARWRLFKTAALYGLNRRYALLGSLSEPTETLARWDALLRARDTPGIVGADAHSQLHITKRWAARFPSYEAQFALAQNHVLLPHPLSGRSDRDAAAVVEALAEGRSYVALDALADARSFDFVAEDAGTRWTMGATVPATPGLHLRAGGRLPRGARVRLLRNGQEVAWAEAGVQQEPPVAPGVYRVEVRVDGWDAPWILSNPIYVFDAAEAAQRREKAAWPEMPPPPEPVQVLDAFEGATSFAPEFDTTSSMGRDVVQRGAGIGGSAAARLSFRLGAPAPGHPYTWCALVSRQDRDLSAFKGLVFSIRADGIYRIWVQVRDANSASADEGTEWWFASVRTSPRWRRVAIPFSRFRTINPKSDGRLDLDKVKQLVFVLDEGAVKVGTQGSIWIDDLGVF